MVTRCSQLLRHGFNAWSVPQAGGYSAVFPVLRAYERLCLKARVFLSIPEWDNKIPRIHTAPLQNGAGRGALSLPGQTLSGAPPQTALVGCIARIQMHGALSWLKTASNTPVTENP